MDVEGVVRVELVRSTSFGRKRVALSSVCCLYFGGNGEFDLCKPLKRQCSIDTSSSAALLEDLPQEILIRIICGVEHDDLKHLLLVSKSMKEATLIAKQSHFAFSTPRKTLSFPKADEFYSTDNDDIETAPNAPKQSRLPRNRLTPKKLSAISVALFAAAASEEFM